MSKFDEAPSVGPTILNHVVKGITLSPDVPEGIIVDVLTSAD